MRTPTAAPALALLLVLAGCSTDLPQASYLQDLRVLAIEATPLDLEPLPTAGPLLVIEPIALTALEYLPPGVTVAPADRAWSFCPLSVGASAAYACVDPRCELPLAPSGDGGRTASVADPAALLYQCLEATGAAVEPGQLPEVVDFIFRYQVTGRDGAGAAASREVIQRVPFHVGGVPLPRNLPPAFDAAAGVTIGGLRFDVTPFGTPVDTGVVLRPGATLEVATPLTPESAQPYVDAAGTAQAETLIVSYYSTNGQFEYDRANGPDARDTLKYESVLPGMTAEVYAVARDQRGGETVIGPYLIEVQ